MSDAGNGPGRFAVEIFPYPRSSTCPPPPPPPSGTDPILVGKPTNFGKPAASCEHVSVLNVRPPTELREQVNGSRHGALKETLSESSLPTVHPVDRNRLAKPYEAMAVFEVDDHLPFDHLANGNQLELPPRQRRCVGAYVRGYVALKLKLSVQHTQARRTSPQTM